MTHFQRMKKSKSQSPKYKRLPRQKRGYDDSHFRLRKMVMAEQPICAAPGCNKPGVEMDHIDSNPWNRKRENLQMLCKSCHSSKTGRTHSPEFLPSIDHKPSIPVTVVCGPPGSGKTTYVRENATDGDIIIDLDEIKSRLSGLPWYQAGDKWLKPAIAERNCMIGDLANARPGVKAWLIVSGQRMSTRRHWRDSLCAEVVMLETAPEVCIQRIKNDPRRVYKWEKYEEIINKWYRSYVADFADNVIRG